MIVLGFKLLVVVVQLLVVLVTVVVQLKLNRKGAGGPQSRL